MVPMERAVAASTRRLLDDVVRVARSMEDGTVTRAEGEAENIALATAWLRALRGAYGQPGVDAARRHLGVVAAALQERPDDDVCPPGPVDRPVGPFHV
jgi:hypothetical protein